MRMTEQEFQNKISQSLKVSIEPSLDFEARLFESANGLLAQRRHLLDLREKKVPLRNKIKAKSKALFQDLFQIFVDFFHKIILEPKLQMVSLASIAMILLLIRIRPHHSHSSFANLPDLPKFNDASARYESEWQSEQLKYEEEVIHAQNETNGGL